MSTSLQNGSRELAHRRDKRLVEMFDRCQWYDLALMRHGFTAERLQKLARKIANDELRLRGATLGDRFDDLVSRLVIVGLDASLRYDPERHHASYGKNGGEPFASYVADVMQKRVTDHFRSKAEGFGDRRYGLDDRVDLSDDPDPADHDTDFEVLVDDRRRSRYQEAAKTRDETISEWTAGWLDVGAENDLGSMRYRELGGGVIGRRPEDRMRREPEDVDDWMRRYWTSEKTGGAAA